MDFGNVLSNSDALFVTKFEDRQSRLERSELTENIKNTQISAEIYKKSNASKNADIKSTTANLQAAECNQLQQAPSSKIGGGGARAARRIRIIGHVVGILLS